MKRRIIALLILITLSSIPPASARQFGNSIRGKVRNSSGTPMPRVVVELQSSNGQPINQTVTNNEGDFFFGSLTATGYQVFVSVLDYNTALERVDFAPRPIAGEGSPGETRTIEITLNPKERASIALPPPRSTLAQNIPKLAADAFERGMKLSKEGKAEESIAALREAIKIFPEYFNAHFMLGQELSKTGRLDEAVTELEQARKIDPKNDRVYQSFGIILMQQKKYALAAAVFGEAGRLNPTDPQIPLMRATTLIDQASTINAAASKQASDERNRLFAVAEKDLERANELSGKKLATIHLQKARLYDKKGEPLRAADELEQYLRKAPDDKKAESLKEAIKKLRAASEQKPGNL